MFRVIAPKDYRRMPWKNGGGVTDEIAAYPEGAALDAFDWRVSIAAVTRNGPFSRFPGIDRTIVLIEGAGMRLAGKQGDVVLRTPFEPHALDGDEPLDCALISGPIRDFNAMIRRDRARGSVAAVRSHAATIDAADFRLAFAAIGTHDCRIAGHPPIALPPHHTLVVERIGGAPDATLAIRPRNGGDVALAVRIECR